MMVYLNHQGILEGFGRSSFYLVLLLSRMEFYNDTTSCMYLGTGYG